MVNYGRNPDIGKILRQQRKSITLTMRKYPKNLGSRLHISVELSREAGFHLPRFYGVSPDRLVFEEAELMMLAGYLSPLKQGVTEEKKGYRIGKMDPMSPKSSVMNL